MAENNDAPAAGANADEPGQVIAPPPTSPSPPLPSNPTSPSQLDGNKNFFVVLAIVLLMAYLSPMLYSFHAWRESDGFNRQEDALELLVAFLGQSSFVIDSVHKLLFPIVVGVSAFAFRGDMPGKLVYMLGALVLAAFSCAVVLSVVYSKGPTANAFNALYANNPAGLLKAYLDRTQEVMLMYFSTLLGLSLVARKGDPS